MVTFVFTKFAHKRFQKISPAIQKRVTEKLKELKYHPDILSLLKPLHNFAPATHRLRIGDYRLILQVISNDNNDIECLIMDVGHRREVYR